MANFKNDFRKLGTVDRTKYQSLYTAYKEPSKYKQEVYENCYQIAKRLSYMSGYELVEYGVISHNVQVFTFGMVFLRGDGDGFFELVIRPSTYSYWLNFVDDWTSNPKGMNNNLANLMYTYGG